MRLEIDPVVQQFVAVYGVRNLMESLDLQKITKMGDYYMCQCPFHENLREPDFQMHKNLGLFICFGCSASGNLYQFVQRAYNIPYDAANKYIQKLAGFDASFNIDDIKFNAKLQQMFKSEKAEKKTKVRTFSEFDIARMNTGEDPTQYLLGRGFSKETQDYFGATYTDQWVVWDDKTQSRTHQRRIVIPGHHVDGTLAGFIGRTIDGATPKYKYTAAYPKSTSIYNLNRAKKHMNEGLILVEGSLDTWNLHQFGVQNVGGIYGARIHEAQIELICQHTDIVYLMFDNDDAGRDATLKGIEALKDRVVELNIIPLHNFKDPGEITDGDTFAYLKRNALNWRTFEMSSLKAK